MSAQKTELYGKDRNILHAKVPLDTPYSLIMEASSYCNAKCEYCLHSLSHEEMEKAGHVYGFMSEKTQALILEQLAEFPRPIRLISFGGRGEPLTHQNLPGMIAQLRERNVAERISVVTNGVLLTHALSRSLVQAGTNAIKISLQGLSSEEYWDHCKVKMDYQHFLDQIRYLYEHKGQCKIQVKMPSNYLRGDRREQYDKDFMDISDEMGIESIMPLHPQLDFQDIIIPQEQRLSAFHTVSRPPIKVCPLPFYQMAIRQSGKVFMCCYSQGLTDNSFNVHQARLADIWNSAEWAERLKLNLLGKRDGITASCAGCGMRDNMAFDENILDDHAPEIYERIFAGHTKPSALTPAGIKD